MARATESAAIAWLSANGFDVPMAVAIEPTESVPSLLTFGPPWIVKPDVAIGGKGMSGAVKRVDNANDLSSALSDVVDAVTAPIRGARAVVEEFVEGDEMYLAFSIDEAARAPMVRFSKAAGVGFDATTAASCVLRLGGDTIDGELSVLFDQAGLTDPELRENVAALGVRTWRLFRQAEALLLEFNPIRWDGTRAVPVGFACELDDNASASARNSWPEVETGPLFTRPPTDRERLVDSADRAEPRLPLVRFLELEGDTALLVVGGGAALLCFDHLHERGARPACYADYSPGAGSNKLRALVEAGLSMPGIKGGIFGAVVVSLADVMELARGLVDGIHAAGIDPRQIPIVARIAGPNEEAATELMRSVPGLITVGRERTLEGACDLLLEKMGLSGRPAT